MTAATPEQVEPARVPAAERFDNRELSWLEFDAARARAGGERQPRRCWSGCKFLAIFGANLDEFFQIRVAGLKEQILAGLASTSPDGMSPAEQFERISARVRTLMARQHKAWAKTIQPRLANAGISVVDWEDLDAAGKQYLHETYEERIYPILTPLSVDPVAPVPVHLQPVAQPRGRGAWTPTRQPPVRAREGAAVAPAVPARCPTASGSCRTSR